MSTHNGDDLLMMAGITLGIVLAPVSAALFFEKTGIEKVLNPTKYCEMQSEVGPRSDRTIDEDAFNACMEKLKRER